MIVTTGRHIKVEAGGFFFERTAETPGAVTVLDKKGGRMQLPTNEQERQYFIAAYERVCSEDVAYRKSEVENVSVKR